MQCSVPVYSHDNISLTEIVTTTYLTVKAHQLIVHKLQWMQCFI